MSKGPDTKHENAVQVSEHEHGGHQPILVLQQENVSIQSDIAISFGTIWNLRSPGLLGETPHLPRTLRESHSRLATGLEVGPSSTY